MIKTFFSAIAIAIFSITVMAQAPEMILIEGGEFTMGNDYSSELDESPEHKVTLSDFYIGKYEVTFDEFDQFCAATGFTKPDDGGYGRGKIPVANISWNSAIMFCNWLSARDGLNKFYNIKRDSTSSFTVTLNESANGYRLPTEAEWEYVARGGKKGKTFSFSGSNNVDEVAWWKGNSNLQPHEVGLKQPNEVGVYDMSGNTWEWCWDIYDKGYYKKSPASNPKGAEKGIERVYRGGNWNCTLDFLRLTARNHFGMNKEYGLIGLRLAKNK